MSTSDSCVGINKPKDPTIAEKFNTYRSADCKEQMIYRNEFTL